MTEPDDIDLLRRAFATRVGRDPRSHGDCLDDETVAALAEGALDDDTRAVVLPHLAGCAPCRRRVASVARALADPMVAREIRAAEGGRRGLLRRTGWISAGSAAAAVLLLLALPARFDEPPAHRESPITAAAAPAAVSPVGPVAGARSLRWTAVSGADRYRIALFDAEGGVLYEAELTDTVAVLPDSVLPAQGETYWWQVDARIGFDRWVASDLIQFSVARGTQR